MAHIALADDATGRIELRDGVGTVPDTILAANASISGVKHNACDGIFGVGVDGAALDALSVETVIATH